MVLELILVAIVGLFAGGIVNVLADDLPLRRSVRLPRYLPDEKKCAVHSDDEDERAIMQQDDERRPFIAWLGTTAFLFGKRTSPNGVRLSWRYPLAEFLTAFLMMATIYAVNRNETLSEVGTAQTILWLIFMVFFALIIVIDIEHKLILFVVVIPFALVALLDAYLTTRNFGPFYQPHLRDALSGGVAGFVVFFILYNGGFVFTYIMGKLRGEEISEVAFGYGDVMLAAVSGIILGWQALIFAMFITVFLGAFGAVLYLVSRRFIGAKYNAFTALPYGPYIVVGTILMLLYRTPVSSFLMGG